MNTKDFVELYNANESDETITPFRNEAGFSLIRLYPEGTQYFIDGRRMFIKIAVLDRGFFYRVDMTTPLKDANQTEYVITDGEEYKKRVTNFFSDGKSEEFFFDEGAMKVRHTKTKKEFSLNQFVDLLARSHQKDLLFWKRKLNSLANLILRLLFWLSDKHYEMVKVSIDKYHFTKNNKPIMQDQKNIEPFFKYFYISKNLIFGILLVSFLTAILVTLFPELVLLKQTWSSLFGEFTLSNPLVFLLFFLGLFSAEKLSVWLNNKIKDFLMPEQNIFSKRNENFVEKLHNYQQHNKFNLNIKV